MDQRDSGEQIHDRVCGFAEAGIKEISSGWAKQQRLDPFLVTWPSSILTSKEGQDVGGPCLLYLADIDPKQWTEKIAQAVNLTRAYAVLLAEQKEDAVVITMETADGSRCWTLPIIRSGDMRRLGKPAVSNNVERLGVLWNPRRNRA